jgi:3-oxoacyl-[acyl-carrier protein] reductase
MVDRVALVTGVSRRIGIAAEIVRRLLTDGVTVFATGWQPHDSEMPWGADDTASLLAHLDAPANRFAYEPFDLELATSPEALVARVVEHFGRIDIVVAAHARSSHSPLDVVTAKELDKCWAVNARASLLLTQSFGRRAGPGGRVVLFTSGQHIAPMDGEIAYAVSKGAIHQMTKSLANALADRGITVKCINPGPVDTGWASDDVHASVEQRFPAGRWGQPSDIASVVAFLVSQDAAWVQGQVLDVEGGWRRWS